MFDGYSTIFFFFLQALRACNNVPQVRNETYLEKPLDPFAKRLLCTFGINSRPPIQCKNPIFLTATRQQRKEKVNRWHAVAVAIKKIDEMAIEWGQEASLYQVRCDIFFALNSVYSSFSLLICSSMFAWFRRHQTCNWQNSPLLLLRFPVRARTMHHYDNYYTMWDWEQWERRNNIPCILISLSEIFL